MAIPSGTPRGPDLRPPEWKLPPNWLHYVVLAVLALVLVLTARSAVYTVGTDEKAVVLRLGRLQQVVGPGFHFKLPFGLDLVQRLPVEKVLKEEFGFRTVRTGVRSEFAKKQFEDESNMLTGDLNIADVEWIVQYKIADPVRYFFNLQEPEQTVRDMAESSVRQVVGSRTVDQVLTVGRQEIEAEAQRVLQTTLNAYDAGIRVEAMQLRNVTPPEAVQASFNDVNKAEQDRERLIDQARAAYNREIPAAEGEALRTVAQAEGRRIDRVNRAEGDASRFLQILGEYKKAPAVTRRRLYLETLTEVLPAVDQITVMDGDTRAPVLPLLNLGGAQ